MATVTVRQALGSTSDAAFALSAIQFDGNFTEKYAAAAHGFAVGDLVYKSGSTTWAKATNAAGTSVADGIVVSVPDANTAYINTRAGVPATKTAHGLGAAGTVVYLSTAGGMTATAPSPIRQRVGKVLDANTVLFHAQFPHEED